ncbi:MAG: Nif3-like dinuclear metal center hexameric protein [Verrucomicrobia bacterium]|nr:Nif3-like dinuclear metal center hexameric protein [Verrucomicrobiota bacterium]
MKKPSTRLSPLISSLNVLLNTAAVSDYPGAVNGLQIANSGVITRIAAAVDAGEAVISEAARVKGTLLLVHHGLFWNGVQPITGPLYRKIKAALDGDLALYSSHLPLDLHPKLGNNILLAKALGLTGIKPALELMGQSVGVTGKIKSLTRNAFALCLSEAIGAKVHVAAGGSKKIQSVLVVTGGAGSQVARAAELGVDAFVTGEGPHWSYTSAEELGVNLFYAGHYATETFGVKALASHLSAKTGLPWSFVDHPTGL